MVFYSVQQFRTFRTVFGLYLAWHFATLLPAAKELFSQEGMISDPTLLPTWWLYRMLLLGSWNFEEPWAITTFLTTMVLVALAFAGGYFRRLSALILWYGWTYLFNRNIFIANPGLPYVGWLLLACVIIPPDDSEPSITVHALRAMSGTLKSAAQSLSNHGNTESSTTEDDNSENGENSDDENGSDDENDNETDNNDSNDNSTNDTSLSRPRPRFRRRKGWYMPRVLYYSAWFLMAAGYTISGLHKLQCPSWRQGIALTHILEGLLSRHNFLSVFLVTHPFLLRLLTWVALILEIGFLPFGVFHRTRKNYWFAMIAMHVGVISVINFTDLTIGVLMIHFFTFDHRWWREPPLSNLALFWDHYQRLSPIIFPMFVVLMAGLWVGFVIVCYSSSWAMSILLFSVIGLALSAYSYYIETRQEENYVAMCDLKWASCTKVFKSSYGSLLAGQPNSFWGLLFYALTAFLAVIPILDNAHFTFFPVSLVTPLLAARSLQVLAGAACIGSVFLAYLLVAKIKTICVVCVSIYATNVMLLYTSQMLLGTLDGTVAL